MAGHTIYILNGPNLNLLGEREQALYGSMSLLDLESLCKEQGSVLGLNVVCRQSNYEGDLITWIHEARQKADGLILNAAGFSHTSIALLDALRAFEKPSIEVHLSNIFRRESYRRHSYMSEAVNGVICGLGASGYQAALIALADRIGVDENAPKKSKKGSK